MGREAKRYRTDDEVVILRRRRGDNGTWALAGVSSRRDVARTLSKIAESMGDVTYTRLASGAAIEYMLLPFQPERLVVTNGKLYHENTGQVLDIGGK